MVLMVSGGADSTALTLMACTGELDIDDGRGCARIARERLHVLHVNHHLRGEASDGDEAFVR
ncbi:tRNA(Ile)-lysidine synthetase, partial [Bacteroides fragilis]